jgi:putative transposase
MPRISRALFDNCCCHIINRGNGRGEVFHKDGDYRAFIELMRQAREKYPIAMQAWCLMPNHFHLLVQLHEADQLNKFMQWLMTSHVRRYHSHYKTSGHVWQGRFKSFIIQDDDHLLTVVRYIEANPVRAGLSATAAQWPWSSHRLRGGASGDAMCPDPLPIVLPGDWSAYVDTPLTDREIERLRNSVNRQTPFGLPAWRDELCEKMGLESTIRPRGWISGRKRGANKQPVPLFPSGKPVGESY